MPFRSFLHSHDVIIILFCIILLIFVNVLQSNCSSTLYLLINLCADHGLIFTVDIYFEVVLGDGKHIFLKLNKIDVNRSQ